MARDMIFVSHANPEDNEFARWLSLRLANEGYPVWCDLTKLLGGETFWDDIQKAIKERTIKFLFILSRYCDALTRASGPGLQGRSHDPGGMNRSALSLLRKELLTPRSSHGYGLQMQSPAVRFRTSPEMQVPGRKQIRIRRQR